MVSGSRPTRRAASGTAGVVVRTTTTEGDRDDGARLVRIDDLRRCLAVAFERLQLASGDAEGLSGLLGRLGAPRPRRPRGRGAGGHRRPLSRRHAQPPTSRAGAARDRWSAPARRRPWLRARRADAGDAMVPRARPGALRHGGRRGAGLAARGRRPLRQAGGGGGPDRLRLHQLHPRSSPRRAAGRRSSAPIPSPTACPPDVMVPWSWTSARRRSRFRRSGSRPRRGRRCGRGSPSTALGVRQPIRTSSSRAGRWRRSAARWRRTRASGWPCSLTPSPGC